MNVMLFYMPLSSHPERSMETLEHGANIRGIVQYVRHGEREKDGRLRDDGRRITAERAKEFHASIDHAEFDYVKAYGSTAGPKGPTGQERSLESAHIVAEVVSGGTQLNTRRNPVLSYETLKLPTPYDHLTIYDSNLPEDFETLPEAEKIAAAKKAQIATVDYLMSLDTPEAIAYREEIAGAFAVDLLHKLELMKRMKSGKTFLFPSGTHGGNMEPFLQLASVHDGEYGERIDGFGSLAEIGGAFDPSEAFNVALETDGQGYLLPMCITYTNRARPVLKNLRIDLPKLIVLAEKFEVLHAESERE